MKRGWKTNAEHFVLKPQQIKVQTSQSKSIAVACKEADIFEQSYATSA